jgi:thiol-disulfide isomerase/thioredoxin
MDFGKIKSLFTSNSKIIVGVLLVVLLLVGIYFYVTLIHKKSETKYVANYQNHASSKQVAELMFFYADWCPHCKVAKGDWEQLKAEYDGKQLNGYNLVFREINCTTESPETDALMSQYQVEGYPTFKLVKGDEVMSFEAKPTKDNLSQFLQTMV